jgi:hypothetical protein
MDIWSSLSVSGERQINVLINGMSRSFESERDYSRETHRSTSSLVERSLTTVGRYYSVAL